MADSAVPTAPTGPSFPSADISSAALAALDTPAASQPVESVPAPAGLRPTTPTYAKPTTSSLPLPTAPAPEGQPAPAAPEPQELNLDGFYKVTTRVNGVDQTEVITGKQVLERQMNFRSYTQKTQNLQQEKAAILKEKQGIAEMQRQAAESQAILNDPGRLAAYVQGKFPHLTIGQAQAAAAQIQQQQGITPPQQPYQQQQPQVPQVDPQGLASIGDVQQQVSARIAELEAELGRRASVAEKAAIQRTEERIAEVAQKAVAETIGNLQAAHAVAGYDRQIDNHFAAVLAEHPVLAEVPDLNDLVRFRVQQMNPQTVEEMLSGISTVMKTIAEGISSHYQQQQVAQVAAKAKLTTNGMAIPSGITPTAPAPASNGPFSSGGKANWKGLSAEVGAALDSLRSR